MTSPRYMVVKLDKTAAEACAPLQGISPPLAAFRDASYNNLCAYKLTVEDCAKGLSQGEDARRSASLCACVRAKDTCGGDCTSWSWLCPCPVPFTMDPVGCSTTPHPC